MDFEPTDEQRAIRETVRRFVDKELLPFEPLLMERDINGLEPHLTDAEERQLREKAKASGLWGVDTPEEYGGADLDWGTQALINMELGRTFIPFTFGGSAQEILYRLNDDQKRRYLVPTIQGEKRFCFMLSEPGVGSDARNIQTTAVRDGDGWVINGEKTWISRGNDADYGVAFCRTRDDSGTYGVTAFLVDRDMGWKSSPVPVMGVRNPATISFQDVRVPDDNRFGEVNAGFDVAMRLIHRNRAVVMPALWAGACERLLEMAIDYAKNRVTWGEPLADRENIRFMIAESEVELRTLKLLTLHAAWVGDTGRDPRHSSCFTKFHGARVANAIVDRVLQIHGGMGYSKELPIERWYRDFRIARIYEGTDEINLLSISRNLLRGYDKVGQVW
ncbi:acyl-CoA dehydrogenase family protein [Pseudonocardia ailaonensis]|uniref:acyl-CoA dehydrogenase family protein n=1 Tax=Pseudonocardia ailaonensis TaxID=367279 RepID=UPI0031DA6F23